MSSKQGTQIETDIYARISGWSFHEIIQDQNRFSNYSSTCKCIVPFHRHVNRALNVLPFKNEQQKIQHTTKFNMIEHDNDLKLFTEADTGRQLIYILHCTFSFFHGTNCIYFRLTTHCVCIWAGFFSCVQNRYESFVAEQWFSMSDHHVYFTHSFVWFNFWSEIC